MENTGKCGENVFYKFNSDSGVLTVSGRGDMFDYNPLSEERLVSPFYGCSEIKTVVIESGVCSVGREAFADCSNTVRVFIAPTVKRIGTFAFLGCEKLEAILLPEGVCFIDDYAFLDCIILRRVIFPKTLKKVGKGIFCGCDRIEEAYYTGTNGELQNIEFDRHNELFFESIENRFYEAGKCGENVYYAYNSSTSVLTICGSGEMNDYSKSKSLFENDYSINRAYVEEGVCSIGSYTFKNCFVMESISIAKSVEKIGEGAFYDCVSLEKIRLPHGVKVINSNVFYNCFSLSDIFIPDSVERVCKSAFVFCGGLKAVYYPAPESSWDKIDIFEDNYDLIYCDIVFDCGSGSRRVSVAVNSGICGAQAYYYFDFESRTLTISGSGAMFDYAENGENELCSPFAGSRFIERIVIEEGITEIGSAAFADCYYLRNVDIPESVCRIGEAAFAKCDNLYSIRIPEGVKTIRSRTFYYCDLLSVVYIPKSLTRIERSAFGKADVIREVCHAGSFEESKNIIVEQDNNYYLCAYHKYNE